MKQNSAGSLLLLSTLATAFAFFSSGCKDTLPEKIIAGDWKVDSTYSYYNGFAQRQYREGADWAIYSYAPDSTVKEIKYGTHRLYHYTISGDTLFWDAAHEEKGVHFKILKLTPERLILRKEKIPLLGGSNQERYEVRYFSRTQAPQNTQLYQAGTKNEGE